MRKFSLLIRDVKTQQELLQYEYLFLQFENVFFQNCSVLDPKFFRYRNALTNMLLLIGKNNCKLNDIFLRLRQNNSGRELFYQMFEFTNDTLEGIRILELKLLRKFKEFETAFDNSTLELTKIVKNFNEQALIANDTIISVYLHKTDHRIFLFRERLH